MKRRFRKALQWLVRLLLRVGLLPASTRADTDTMGEWKRLMAEKDDPKPGLVLPDPNAPHAALIHRVRLYAQNGAKALAPLLDVPVSASEDERIAEVIRTCAAVFLPPDAMGRQECTDDDAQAICVALRDSRGAHLAAHAAYNSPWTVVDGEVYEYESDKRKRVVQ